MSTSSTRPTSAWAVTAHVVAAALLGALEAARLGNARLALALIPVYAATGLVLGAAIAGAEATVRRRGPWLAAAVVALPSLIITVPIAASTFRGAYAQTLPGASLLPIAAPAVAWGAIAVAVRLGRRFAGRDLTTRGILVLVMAGGIGAVMWVDRNILGTGYADAQIGAALAVLTLAGIAVRGVRRGDLSPYAAAVVAAITIGSAVAAATVGLARPEERRLLADRGEHGRDLVRLWRSLLDFDRDGSSALLGGGDCDDRDPTRHPGARDVPGDGIDQDCDGVDAEPPAPPPDIDSRDWQTWRASPEVAAVFERTRSMNVLLISIDALRADLLAPGAPRREDFPNLTQLLDESVYFARAFSPGAGTDISLSTLFSGRFDPFQELEVTLAEAMRAGGRRTTSVVPREVTRHVGEVLLERGYDTPKRIYTDWDQQDVGDHVSAGTTTSEGLRLIDKAGAQPWFTWLHYFDVHEHHQIAVPSELRREVHDGGSDKVHRYRALLRGIDRSIGRLREELAKRQLADRTIIAFVSDHGESLHGDPRMPATHGQVAYGPLIHIPIAIHVPGVAGGVRTDPVSLVDLAPTLLGLVGLPDAIPSLDGIDLAPSLLDGPAALRPAPDRALIVHEEQQWSVIEWPYQVVVRPADDLTELYDLSVDPGATQDLAAREPELTRRLRARYAEVPDLRIDRTVDGRAARERRARPPQPRAKP